jgi:heme exporter protein D
MFGFGDVWVFLAYFMTIAAMVLCVVYGVINWNKPKEDVVKEVLEEAEWEKKDPELNEGGAK